MLLKIKVEYLKKENEKISKTPLKLTTTKEN